MHLTRGAGSSRLKVLATYRDTETGGREPLRQTLATLASESVTRLRLVGLTEPEVETLLSGIAGSGLGQQRGEPPYTGESVLRRRAGEGRG